MTRWEGGYSKLEKTAGSEYAIFDESTAMPAVAVGSNHSVNDQTTRRIKWKAHTKYEEYAQNMHISVFGYSGQ